jgi:hypothetical protein
MTGILINPTTEQAIRRIIKQRPHAVMLAGAAGSGKTLLAHMVASDLLAKPAESHPYFRSVEPVKGAISIETVRALQKFMSLRTLGTGDVRRIVVVSDAHDMTIEAQNAFLKTLEEPPADTVIILTSTVADAVLPTIASRVTVVRILPVSRDAAMEYYAAKGFKSSAVALAWALSHGQPGLMDALINDSESHELVAAVGTAKKLLGMNLADRLASVDGFAKDKTAIAGLLSALSRIAQTALEQSALNGKHEHVVRWHRIATKVNQAAQDFSRNANSKLLLTDLMLNLS